MMRALVVGIWACVATMAGTYGGVYFRQHSGGGAHEAGAHEEKMETRKVKPITVPIIADGVVKGYVSAEFNIIAPKSDAHAPSASLDPEGFILDEAFRLIYAESKLDFSHIEKTDLASLTERITANVNQRLGKTVVKETLVKNFTFVPKEDLLR